MTKIEWTEKTWNPVVGCSIVSPGCTNCYAMKMASRIERMNPELAHYRGLTRRVKDADVWTGKLALAPDHILLEPLRRKKPTMYFVNSMSDLFHEDVPDDWIDRVFAVMALCPQHTFQVLTKRSARMRAYFQSSGESFEFPDGSGTMHLPRNGGLLNVWLGVSAEDQKRADERIPDLLATPAAERFVSAEPLLGPIDFTRVTGHSGTVFDALVPWRPCRIGGTTIEHGASTPILDWVIVGGESGKGARPMQLEWVEDIVSQCAAAGVSCFVKQLGSRPQFKSASSPEPMPYLASTKKGGDPAEWPDALRVREMPNAH